MDTLRDILINLLSNLASRKEIDQYLREFTGVDSTKFAVIKVGGGILRHACDELAFSLSFLQRVGLFPIVVHGAGPQMNTALAEAGITSTTCDGLRITNPDVLQVARRVLAQENLNLVEALEQRGTRARPITSGVFEADLLDHDRYGLVGTIEQVHLEPVDSAIRAGQLPIVACLGESRTGQILNVNADTAARSLALAVQPYKVIFLTPTGGLLDERGRLIPAINLAEDYEQLMQQSWVNGGMELKLREIHQLLDGLPATSSVSITRPDHLACELFTHRGSGTLVRRGESIEIADSFDDVDLAQLRTLIETGFGYPLRDDYFFTRTLERIYLTGGYSSAAIVTREADMAYLDKFAVTVEAQGAGLGASLWNRMRSHTPQLFWRSRPDNQINTWYFRQADGTYRTDDWVVFWYGLHSRDIIERCIEHALQIPPSLEYSHDTKLHTSGVALAAGA